MSIFPNPSPMPPEQPATPAYPSAAAPPLQPPGPYAPPQVQYSAPAYYAPPPEAKGSGWKTGLVIAAIVLLAGANVYLFMQLNQVRQDLAKNMDATQARL